MSKFASNPLAATAASRSRRPDTINLAGGQAHTQSARLELASIVLTSFLKDQFYRSEKETVARLNELFAKVEPVFIAKLACFARHEYGMRSVSHFAAAWIDHHVHGWNGLRSFYKNVVRRPDDILEILACYIALAPAVAPVVVPAGATLGEAKVKVSRLRLPNAMKRGLGDKLTLLSPEALAKYRKDGAELSMIDAINLCHPKHSEAIGMLIKGTLPTADTWETSITAAGQNLAEGEDVATAKGAEWDRLLNERKLGYFALLRNIRNICEHATNPLDELCRQLVDAAAIKQSLVLPFRFTTAIKVVEGEVKMAYRNRLIEALTDAVDLAMGNLPALPGRTLVALDDSGSMEQHWDKAAVLAAAAAKGLKADLIVFGTEARYEPVNTRNPVLTIARNIVFHSGGTNFQNIFTEATKHGVRYDRIIIISDMQAWIGHHTPAAEFREYCRVTSARPKVFSLDLAGYGTMQFPEADVYCMAGFSEKVFDTMAMLEHDQDALLNRIYAQEI